MKTIALLLITLSFLSCSAVGQTPQKTSTKEVRSTAPKTIPRAVYLSHLYQSFLAGCLQGVATHITARVITPDMVKFCEVVMAYANNPSDAEARTNYRKLFRFKTK